MNELIETSARVRVPEHVVHHMFDNETVVLNLQTGQYHGLNATGGRILDSLVRSETVADAAQALATEYGQPYADVERDVRSFCDDLAGRGLIEIAGRGKG